MEIYIHIPFCVKKCDYCDFLSGPADGEGQEAYVQGLLREIRASGERYAEPVDTVFIGGGTPSVLEGALMGKILKQLKHSFAIAPDAEITIEANPGTLSAEKLEICLAGGVNRLSLGLQSVHDRELQCLGRIHTYRQFLETYELARRKGFTNINVDLMFAIPEQTREGWEESLRTVAGLEPEHISAYSLIVEEGTPFAARRLRLPDEDTEYAMYEDTAEILQQYGYGQYEISNYARPGRECRHNIGYWTGVPYLGLGLGAASLMCETRFSNTSSMEKYLEASRRRDFPECIREERTKLSMEDRMAEFMFLGLRMTKGVSREAFLAAFGKPMEAVYGPVIEKYKSLSLLAEAEDRVFLTRRGIHVSNTVMADMLL